MSDLETKLITIAKVGAAVGVKGELKLHVLAEDPDSVLDYTQWYIQRNHMWQPIDKIDIRAHGEGYVVRLEGCQDRDIAKRYTHMLLAVSRDELPAPQEGEHYWADLEGLEVVTLEGVKLGTVDHLFETGANDVVVVKGERERLLPYIDDVIKSVDVAAGKMTVDWDPEF